MNGAVLTIRARPDLLDRSGRPDSRQSVEDVDANRCDYEQLAHRSGDATALPRTAAADGLLEAALQPSVTEGGRARRTWSVAHRQDAAGGARQAGDASLRRRG